MDPSRTQQILVNLITNAIKFTTEQSQEKVISLRLGASRTEPTHFEGVDFLARTATGARDWTDDWRDLGLA